MDLTKMSETELKATAYDESIKAQTAQHNISVINQELASRKPVETEKEKDDRKDK